LSAKSRDLLRNRIALMPFVIAFVIKSAIVRALRKGVPMKLPTRSLAAAVAAVSLVTSSVAGAAPAIPASVNPLVTLSIFGTAQSRAALCAAGSAAVAATAAAATTAAATTAAQAPTGCVLPVGDAPPPVVTNTVPPPEAPVAPYYEAAAAAPNLWPLLAGLALFGGIFFLLDDEILGDDDFDFDIPPGTPVSPV
jgi:hypothetical protein